MTRNTKEVVKKPVGVTPKNAVLPPVPAAQSTAPFGLPGLDASSPIFSGYVPATSPGITPLGTSTAADEATKPTELGMDKILLYGGIGLAALIILPKVLK